MFITAVRRFERLFTVGAASKEFADALRERSLTVVEIRVDLREHLWVRKVA